MILRYARRIALLSAFACPGILQAYDDVKIEKIVPLVDKKAVPTLLRLDNQNRLWILNRSIGSLQMVSEEGKVVRNLVPGKKADALYKQVMDFGFSKNGDLLVADGALDRIAVISLEEKPKLLSSFPVKSPASLAVSADNVVAVYSKGQNHIAVYSMDGVFMMHHLSPENTPFKNVASMAYAKNGVLWVLDEAVDGIHRFGPDRKWLGLVKGVENGVAMAVDRFGFGYALVGGGRWKEMNADGTVTGTFGTKGKNPGEMLDPTGIAVQDAQRLWVSEEGTRRLQLFQITNKDKTAELFPEPASYLQVRLDSRWDGRFDNALFLKNGDILFLQRGKAIFERIGPDGKEIASWKKKGKEGFLDPYDMALSPEGDLWITDQGDHSLKKLSDEGQVLQTLGGKGKKEGSFQNPSLVQIRHDASFVVVDKGNSRAQVISPAGIFLFSVGSVGKKSGQFSTITDIAVNSEKIALLDSEKKSLLFFDTSGKYSFEIGNKQGQAPVWNNPVALTTDPGGRFYVLDQGSRRIRIFNAKGQFLADFSTSGAQLAAGSNNEILVLDEKESVLYDVCLVSRAVTDLSAADAEGEILITWAANPEAQTYNVYVSSESIGAAGFRLFASTPIPHVIDSNVIPRTTYRYAVTGVNSAGHEGSWAVSKPVKPSRRKDVSLVSIVKTNFDPIFTAAFKYYVTNPIGAIEIQNNDERSYRDVKVALLLKKYTDFATEIVVPQINGGEKLTVPLTLTFNNQVLELTENTPVQAEIRISYYEDNVEKSVSQNAPITLYSRNAISWMEKARITSFVTPRDAPIADFSRIAIRAFLGPLKGSTVTKPLAKAALFYETLNALGISYVPDPKTPYAEASGRPDILDYVQFPRETLRRKTGDCDDTTALMAALLESVGVEVALVDTPGHIFLMANLEESDPNVIGLPVERFVEFRGTYWVPIETTKLSKDFLQAWQAATAKVNAAKEKNQLDFVPILDATEKYPPVTLVEEAKDIPPFPEEKVRAGFLPVLAKLQNERYEGRLAILKAAIAKNPEDKFLQIQLGMAHVEGGKPEEGKKIFEALLSEPQPDVKASALNNLGNLAYLEANYDEADKQYTLAGAVTPHDGGVIINQARVAWRKGDAGSTKKLLAQAKDLLPTWREYVSDIPAELLPK